MRRYLKEVETEIKDLVQKLPPPHYDIFRFWAIAAAGSVSFGGIAIAYFLFKEVSVWIRNF